VPVGSADPARPTSPLPAIVGLAVLAMLALAIWILVGTTAGPQPPFLREPGASPAQRGVRDDALVLAGSGSNLPVTRALAAAYAAKGKAPPVVHGSIGSGGGLRALLDGATDIALISRPLTPKERGAGVVAVPYARAPVMIAVHSSVPETKIDRRWLVEIFDGRRTTWSDGSPIVVLQRERGDSSHAAVAQVIPELALVDEAAYQARRWRVIYDDVGMEDAIASTEGSIGLMGSGSLPADRPIRALAFEEVEPTLEALADGRYPLFKDLSFVTIGSPDQRVAELLRFAFSAEGRAVITAHGCAPIGELPGGQ
jgi:phosphate transport system substrate-binding protein